MHWRKGTGRPPVAPIVRFGALGIAFLLGIWGFSQACEQAGIASTLAQDGFRSLRLIVGNFPQALEGRDLPVALHIARWALPLLTVWSMAALAWTQIRNPWRLALIRARGDHLVISGDADSELAARAALGALNEGRLGRRRDRSRGSRGRAGGDGRKRAGAGAGQGAGGDAAEPRDAHQHRAGRHPDGRGGAGTRVRRSAGRDPARR